MLKRKYKFILLFSYFLIVVGLFNIIYGYFKVTIRNKDNERLVNLYFNNYNDGKMPLNEEIIGVIQIPKINLKRVLYDIKSDKNNINSNIEIINVSDMPDVDKGNLILASHSGNSDISYFKDLDKLEIDDEIDIYYNNKNYVYYLVDIYKVEKNGQVEIKRNENVNSLTLITCDKSDKSKQLVYVSELVNIR